MDKEVVIDTKSSYLFMGTLNKIEDHFLTVLEVDVHDHNDFTKTKEIYVMEAAKHGIKVNRKATKIVRSEIIAISLLDDVVIY